MEKTNQGLIQLIVIVILSLIILSLLGISLRSLFSDKTLTENFVFVWDMLKRFWGNYVKNYARYLWDQVKNISLPGEEISEKEPGLSE